MTPSDLSSLHAFELGTSKQQEFRHQVEKRQMDAVASDERARQEGEYFQRM